MLINPYLFSYSLNQKINLFWAFFFFGSEKRKCKWWEKSNGERKEKKKTEEMKRGKRWRSGEGRERTTSFIEALFWLHVGFVMLLFLFFFH